MALFPNCQHCGLSYCSVNVTVVVHEDLVFCYSTLLRNFHRYEEPVTPSSGQFFCVSTLKMEASSSPEMPVTV